MIAINGTEYHRPLLVFAMKEEAGDAFTEFRTIITGIGKINAAYHLIRALSTEEKPDIIINLGTAGSAAFSRGEVVCINGFVQRDMDVSPLGIPKYKTPFSEDPIVLESAVEFFSLPKAVCGTGDSFETQHEEDLYNVVDMEAYALAVVAKHENIPFLCLKYISDGADDNAVGDWKDEVKKASLALKEALMIETKKAPH